MLRSFNLQPRSIEDIDDMPVHPNWIPLVTTHIAADKDDAACCIRTRLDEVIVFADGSGLDGHVGAAAVIVSPAGGRHLQYQLGSDAAHTVFEGELTGILLAVHLLHEYLRTKTALIAVDNQAAIAALINWPKQPGQHLVNEIHAVLKALRRAQLRMRVPVEWVPGHANIHGNERADVLAREAAGGSQAASLDLPRMLRKKLPTSIAALKANRKRSLYPKWTERWALSPRHSKISRIDPCMPSQKLFRAITNRP